MTTLKCTSGYDIKQKKKKKTSTTYIKSEKISKHKAENDCQILMSQIGVSQLGA